ncbi:hypothetical protein LTR53_006286 [Teratosphaeriaceae sp. CCFEE 6253]|nr:hypothetical protein LTR53_006286 [Teratosphaeriaceae sp. CCFEE 6253]
MSHVHAIEQMANRHPTGAHATSSVAKSSINIESQRYNITGKTEALRAGADRMITVRGRTEADLEDCVKLLRRVYAQDGYPVQGVERAHGFLQRGIQRAWIAERDGHIVGHIAVAGATHDDVAAAEWMRLHPDEPCAILERLFIDPKHRGGGTAGALIAAAIGWSNQARVELVLFALVQAQTAIRLYERLGWIRFGTVPWTGSGGQTMDAVCFSSPRHG